MTKQELLDLQQLAERMRQVRKLVQRYFYANYKKVDEEDDSLFFAFRDWYFEQFNDGEERIAIVYYYGRDDRYGANPYSREDMVYVTFDELIEFSNEQD